MKPSWNLLFTVAVVFGLCLPADGTEPPLLIVEGPSALAPITTRLQNFDSARVQSIMNLVGIQRPGSPIRVIVAPE